MIVIFGKQGINEFLNNQKILNNKIDSLISKYNFKSDLEKKAFIKGLNEAIGWSDYYILSAEEESKFNQ